MRLSITGLPDPVIFDVSPAIAAGKSYRLGATATLADGSTTALSPASMTWSSTDPTVLALDGIELRAVQPGSTTLTLSVTGTAVTASLQVLVYQPGAMVREERVEQAACPMKRTCPYEFCPQVGPYWLFPVYESGTIELVNVSNPGWGSPSNYVTQLSREGKAIDSWLLLPTRKDFRTASVPGGFMYVFHMNADVGPCGDVGAVWTHPN